MTHMDEKALEAATEAMQIGFNHVGRQGKRVSYRDHAAKVIRAYEITQLGESEAVAKVVQMGSNLEKCKYIRTLVDIPIGTKLYTAPPSLAAVQADNERLREQVFNLKRQIATLSEGWRISDQGRIEAEMRLAGQEKQE